MMDGEFGLSMHIIILSIATLVTDIRMRRLPHIDINVVLRRTVQVVAAVDITLDQRIATGSLISISAGLMATADIDRHHAIDFGHDVTLGTIDTCLLSQAAAKDVAIDNTIHNVDGRIVSIVSTDIGKSAAAINILEQCIRLIYQHRTVVSHIGALTAAKDASTHSDLRRGK